MDIADELSASLPMYDFAPLRQATDAWWAGISTRLGQRLGRLPGRLLRGTAPAELWRDPALLFSQSCGYPLTHDFRQHLRAVATPAYDAPGCEGARYASAIVVHQASPANHLAALRGSALAFNMLDSMSGYRVWQRVIDADVESFFARTLETGSHHASLAAVARRDADVAAVDAVSFALLGDVEPTLLSTLRVLAFSPTAPGLPYVTRADAPAALVAALRGALLEAAVAPELAHARRRLRISGVEVLADDAYQEIAALE